jgi:two-component system, NarL family, sensor histidine kinase DesK
MEATHGSEVMAQMANSRGPVTLSATGRVLSRRGRTMRLLFTGVWLVYILAPVSQLFGHGHSVPWIVGGLVIAVAFCAIYIYVVGSWQRDEGWRMTSPGLAALFVLAVVACVIYGSDWLTLWIYVSAATGFVLPGQIATRAVLGVSACYALLAWLTHASMTTFLLNLLPVVLIGWAMAGFRYQAKLVHELSLAKETVAKLAASEERLRLARDMHDLTGQSLSMITLKSELVSKLLARLPGSKDRDAALREANDISQVSRRTLHDIRDAVSGYRRPTLAVEIITARTALDAAGIHLDDDPDLTLRSGTFDPEAEAALAWCLREATTNVIRHSGARTCRVRLTERDSELSLEVTDDGHGLEGLAARPGTGPEATPGSGLRGMSERLTALGGRLSLGDATVGGGRRGLRLVATVPASAPATGASDPGWPAGSREEPGVRGRREEPGVHGGREEPGVPRDREEPGVRGRTTPSASVPARPD